MGTPQSVNHHRIHITIRLAQRFSNSIPKDSTKDPHIPLSYQGINLLCAVSKLYSSVLNNRLLPYLENNGLLVDKQNGFRSGRCCQYHVFSACTVIRDRLSQKKRTFGTFIDLQKAFDLWIEMLYYTNIWLTKSTENFILL